MQFSNKGPRFDAPKSKDVILGYPIAQIWVKDFLSDPFNWLLYLFGHLNTGSDLHSM